MVENNSIFEKITTSLSVKDAFQILDLPIGADTTKVQINYHDQVLALEDDLVDASVFAILRVAYEVAIKYNTNKNVDNNDQIIDVSYLREGIKNLSLLQEIYTRNIIAANKEDEFWDNYYSENDSKSVEEQYINVIDDFEIGGLIKNADYLYIKPSTEMGPENSGDYNACKLVRFYIATGEIARAEEIAVYLAKKYRKDMPAIVFALMGDIARVHGNSLSAEQMYRAAIKKNPWEAYEVIRYLN